MPFNIKDFSAKFQLDADEIKQAIPQLRNEIEKTWGTMRFIEIEDKPNVNWSNEALAMRSETLELFRLLNYVQKKLVDCFRTIIKTQLNLFFPEVASSQLDLFKINVALHKLLEFLEVLNSLDALALSVKQEDEYLTRLSTELDDTKLEHNHLTIDTEILAESVQISFKPADNVSDILSQLRKITEVTLLPMLRKVQPEVCLPDREIGLSDRCLNASEAIRECTVILGTILPYSHQVQNFDFQTFMLQFHSWKNDIVIRYEEVKSKHIKSKISKRSSMNERPELSDKKCKEMIQDYKLTQRLYDAVRDLAQIFMDAN
ncbi:hypothetical protein NPIL_108651 [Nephila pilipes]|uniref:Uncharacterized protein n=1 Tax=Nephila pilipes TaxID=299642 RepID=A0A8X6TC60_NEPPI|nr:hypothetical protein NPIL_108651 [Nephila pilipes]